MTGDELLDLASLVIAELDALDGDTDAEETDCEDSFVLSQYAAMGYGAGCLISDPDFAADDVPCDQDTDSEPEDGRAIQYGIDQTRGPISPWQHMN